MMRFKHNEGFITLASVLVVGAIGVATALTLLLLGGGSSRTSFAIEQSNEAKGLVNACAEAALQEVRNSSAFSGGGALSFGQGSCLYTVTNLGGESRLINATGTVGTLVRKVKVEVGAIIPKITVISWDEVAD